MSTLPNTLADIRTKVRRITARPSLNQLSNEELDKYINTYYVYDLPEHLKLISLRYNYEFTTSANVPVYDLPTGTYLTAMPPVYIGGYQSYMTQSRENFFRINPNLNFLQQSISTGNGTTGTYTATLTSTPIMPGFKPNPPGAFTAWSSGTDIQAKFLNWNVVISALGTADPTSGRTPSITLVDDGLGNLFDPADTSINPANKRGTINYQTGAVSITNFAQAIPTGNAINAQYIPYVASRPQSVVFFQDQFIVYPVPDQAYTVSFEAYKYPTAFLATDTLGTSTPQLTEWWQLIALGASLKIFEDNADLENYAKFRQIYEEYQTLVQRRTIVQQTSERTSTIYTEQSQFPGYPFGNVFSGF